MPKINENPYSQIERGDTLGLHTHVPYDPRAKRPSTPIMVGRCVVHRKPLQGQVYTLYMIMDGRDIVRTQISYPTEADCESAIKSSRAGVTHIGQPKRMRKRGWKAQSISAKEAA